jgi:hypothetical protein
MKFRVILTVAVAVTAACAAEPEQPEQATAGQVQQADKSCQPCNPDPTMNDCSLDVHSPVCGRGNFCDPASLTCIVHAKKTHH